jgi:tetratricopeptide (TPR) repeat protein/transposase-like protein
MSFPKRIAIPVHEKLAAVQAYVSSDQSLRSIAGEKGISHKRLLYWVTLYNKGGAGRLVQTNLSKSKLPSAIVEKIKSLKEQNPGLTILRAEKRLKGQGITVSRKTIWRIWHVYGLMLTGGDDPYNIFAPVTPALERIITGVQYLVDRMDFKHAAQIMNSLPRAPYHEVLKAIPEKYLNLRRRLERLWLIRGDIPWPEVMRKARRIRRKYESMGCFRSSLAAAYLEVAALEVIKDPQNKLAAVRMFARKIRGVKTRSIRFLFYRQEAATYAALGQISRALKLIRKCRRLAHSLHAAYYWEATGNLFTNVGDYKQAYRCFVQGSKVLSTPGAKEVFAQRMAHYGHAMAGRYKQGRKLLWSARTLQSKGLFRSLYAFNRADLLFGEGKLAHAQENMLAALEHSTQVTRFNFIFAAAIGLASIAMARNRPKEAHLYLKKYLPLMRKYRLQYETLTLQCLDGQPVKWSDELMKMRSFHLLSLLSRTSAARHGRGYMKAYRYAEKHELLGLFHRRVVFFPEAVQFMLDNARKTGLPRAMIDVPLFNQQHPVYSVHFLGPVFVTRNNERIRSRLTPKESAMLIHIALRSSEPRTFMPVEQLTRNFWSNSRDPSSLLSHLLVSLRKKLKIPLHLLMISKHPDGPRLINQGIFFTTDYDNFKTLCVEISTLIKAAEWKFAAREMYRMFTLVRGDPFKGIYDSWSEASRGVVLYAIEQILVMCREYWSSLEPKGMLRKELVRLSTTVTLPILDIIDIDFKLHTLT